MASCGRSSPNQASAETIVDDVGHQVAVPQRVDRIASLSPAATELLCAVGCCEKIVVRDEWSDFPPQVAKLAALTGFSPSTELLLQHQPQLVFAHWPPANLRSALDAAQIPWFGLSAETLNQVAQAHRIVGRLCGQPERGKKLAIEFAAQVTSIRAAHPRPAKPVRVFYELDAGDGQRPFTIGRRAFGHALIDTVGAQNVFADSDQAWFAVGIEALLAADPDVIVLADADVAINPQSISTLRNRTGFSSLRAVRSGCVRSVPNSLVSRPGPRLIQGLIAMATAVKPCRDAGTQP